MDGNEEYALSLNYADGLIRKLKEENENLKRALRESQMLLAHIIIKNGGSIEVGYRDFFDTKGNYVFTKHENYENDTVIFKVKESTPTTE